MRRPPRGSHQSTSALLAAFSLDPPALGGPPCWGSRGHIDARPAAWIRFFFKRSWMAPEVGKTKSRRPADQKRAGLLQSLLGRPCPARPDYRRHLYGESALVAVFRAMAGPRVLAGPVPAGLRPSPLPCVHIPLSFHILYSTHNLSFAKGEADLSPISRASFPLECSSEFPSARDHGDCR